MFEALDDIGVVVKSQSRRPPGYEKTINSYDDLVVLNNAADTRGLIVTGDKMVDIKGESSFEPLKNASVKAWLLKKYVFSFFTLKIF